MGIASLGGILSGAGDVASPNMGQTSNDFNSLMADYFSKQGDIYGNEATYKPKYANLYTDLFNTGFSKAFGSALPVASAATRSLTPGATGLMDTLSSQAADQLKQNGALDPAMERNLQQSVRTSQAARGLGYGPGDAAMEQYYQTQTQEQRRAQNQALAGNVAQQDWSMFGLPAFNLASGAAGGGAGAAVNASPSLGPNTQQFLTMPYQASLQQNLGTAQNNTSLYESMDKNQTSVLDSAIGKL